MFSEHYNDMGANNPEKQTITIVAIISDCGIKNTIIHTDCNRCKVFRPEHRTRHSYVCHKYKFVKLVNGVHTQRIEHFYCGLKLVK
jgi:hypothetical protein